MYNTRKRLLFFSGVLSLCVCMAFYLLMETTFTFPNIELELNPYNARVIDISKKADSIQYFQTLSAHTHIHNIYATEWYQRLSQIDIEFRDSIAKPFGHKLSLESELNQSCLFFFDNKPEYAKGLGNRFLKISHPYIAAVFSNCSISINWGISQKCDMNDHQSFNLWNSVFLDNAQIIGSNLNVAQAQSFANVYKERLSLQECGASYMRGTADAYPLYKHKTRVPFCSWNFGANDAENEQITAIDSDTQNNIDWRFFADHLKYAIIARFYTTLVYSLKMRYQSMVIQFIEEHFKNRFVIGVHLRFGNGELFGNERQMGIETEYDSSAKLSLICDDIMRGAKIIAHLNHESVDSVESALLIVADQYSVIHDMIEVCADLKEFFNGEILVRPQLVTLAEGVGHMFSVNELPNTSAVRQNQDFGSCDDIMGDGIMDALLLGYSNALLLPHASTFAVLGKLMMQKRRKTVCGKMLPNSITYQCVFWDKMEKRAFTKTFWKTHTISADFNVTNGWSQHWKMIGARSKWAIPRKEVEFYEQNMTALKTRKL